MSPRNACLAALLACVACDREPSRDAAPGEAEPSRDAAPGDAFAGDPWTTQTIESLGDRAAYVVVVDVARWPELRRQLGPLALPSLSQLLMARSPEHWLALALADGTPRDDPPDDLLAGRDPARPIVLALAEPPGDAPGRSFAAGLPLVTGELPGLRHEVVVPAADAERLRRSFAAYFDTLGTARPELVAGQDNASAWQIGRGTLALLVAADHVRVIAVTDAVHAEPVAASPPQLLRAPLQPAPRTAGVVAAARTDAALSVLVRARAQARLALWQIAHDGLVGARSDLPVRASQRLAIERALRCETPLREVGRELEDWTVGLMADERALSIRLVASLADAGIKVWDAGAAAAGPVRAPLHSDLLAHAWLRLAPDAMMTAARDPTAQLASLPELLQLVTTCGEQLPALLAPAPLANLHQLESLAALELPQAPFASAYQIAVRDRGPGVMQSAVALELPGKDDPWPRLWPILADGLGGPPQIERAPAGERTRLDVGFGGRASELLGALGSNDEQLARAELWLAPLRPRLPAAPELAAFLQHAYLHADLRRTGRALIFRLTLDENRDPGPALDLSHVTWSERQGATQPGEACAVQAAWQAAPKLSDPTQLGAVASERIVREVPVPGGVAALDAIDATLGCSEPPAAATSANLRRISALTLAGGLVDEWRLDEAAGLLARACEANRDEVVCSRVAGAKQTLAPRLPAVFVLCDGLARIDEAHRIAMTPAGLALDDRPVADLPALRAALEAHITANRNDLYVDLGIDRDMRFAELRPLLAMLAQIPGLRLAVMMRQELSHQGHALRLPIATPELGPAAPTGPVESSLRHKMGTVVFAADGQAIRLRTGMINLGVEPNPSPGGLQAPTATRVNNGEPPLVHATDDTPWGTVAIALASSCTGAKLIEPAREAELLGPAWRDADCLAVYHGPKPLSVTPKHRGPNNINSGLIAVRPRLEACYAAGLIDDPKLAGRIVATYSIDAEGRQVTDVILKKPPGWGPVVEQCMADAIRSGSHSSADGPVVVRYAFDFKTDRR